MAASILTASAGFSLAVIAIIASLLLRRDRRRHRLKFAHLTKNAGTSIEEIGKSAGLLWGKNHRAFGYWHLPVDEVPRHVREQHDWFMVVRNPYERCVSEVMCRWGGVGNHERRYTVAELNALLRKRILARDESAPGDPSSRVNTCHYLEQYRYQGPNTHVLKFENLAADFDALMALYGLSSESSWGIFGGGRRVCNFEEMPRKNSNGSTKYFSAAHLDASSVELIRNVYREDFRRYGYSSDVRKAPSYTAAAKTKADAAAAVPLFGGEAGFGITVAQRRLPVALRQGALAPSLLAHLRLGCRRFLAEESELAADPSFIEVDTEWEEGMTPPCFSFIRRVKHRCYLGRFHGMTSNNGKAAPVALRAFLECMRRRVAPAVSRWLQREIASRRRGSSSKSSASDIMALEFTLKSVQRGYLFSDVTVEIHAGGALRETLHASTAGVRAGSGADGGGRWNRARPTVLMELVISLGEGRWALHTERAAGRAGLAGANLDAAAGWMQAGDVSLCSSGACEWAFQCQRACRWANRAVLVRAHLPFQLPPQATSVQTKMGNPTDANPPPAELVSCTDALHSALCKGVPPSVPHLAEVAKVERELWEVGDDDDDDEEEEEEDDDTGTLQRNGERPLGAGTALFCWPLWFLPCH